MDIEKQKKVFVSNLLRCIEEKGVNKKTVADYLKISQGTVSDWCMYRSYPRMDKIQKLAEYFGCEKSDLIEARSIDNQYYLKKSVKELSEELMNDPQSVVLFQKFKVLSEDDKKIVEALIDSLGGK